MPLFNFVKSNISIIDVISDYVLIKQAGNYWKGPCPFHYEKEASFTVSPDKEIFYCFGCHATGDVISFIEKKENLSPAEAAKFLVDKYQLEVPEEIQKGFLKKIGKNSLLKNNFFNICKLFSEWANEKLLENKIALDYLKKRNINQELIKYFKIGYFPGGARNINNLLRFIGKKDYMAKDLIDAGILSQGRSVLYSPFEERILFPIHDMLSRCCGFGGRIFREEDKRAKYYNSKESIWFSKGKLLFGIDIAKEIMKEKKSVFLVEGYTDCVSMVKYNYKNVVATLGTACTSDHLKILSRYVETVFVLYDGDTAGQNAISRLTQLCWDVNLELKIITLPKNDDPASFLENGGNLDSLIDNSKNIFSFFIDIESKNFETKTLANKMLAGQKIIELISKIKDDLKREILLLEAGKALEMPISSLKNLVLKEKNNKKPSFQEKNVDYSNSKETKVPVLEEKIFSVIINNVDKPDKLHVPEDLIEYFSKYIQNLFKQLNIFINENTNSTKIFGPFLNTLSDTDRKWVIKCSLKYDQKNDKQTLNELMIIFCKKYWKKIVGDIKEKILQAQQKNNTERVKDLFNLFSQIKNGIKTRGLI
ncbi:DNA primase [Candidatus Dependentiae bacterium]|nr:DNA primase [Candidatus Dependentiae bacterium]